MSAPQRLTGWAVTVFEFLFAHPAISRISILGDFQHYSPDCNSARTQQGFLRALTATDLPEQEKRLLVFLLTTAMQAAFLGTSACKELLGFDLSKQEERAVLGLVL